MWKRFGSGTSRVENGRESRSIKRQANTGLIWNVRGRHYLFKRVKRGRIL
jgi:hypothetical protein